MSLTGASIELNNGLKTVRLAWEADPRIQLRRMMRSLDVETLRTVAHFTNFLSMNDGAGTCSNRSTVGATSTISTIPGSGNMGAIVREVARTRRRHSGDIQPERGPPVRSRPTPGRTTVWSPDEDVRRLRTGGPHSDKILP